MCYLLMPTAYAPGNVVEMVAEDHPQAADRLCEILARSVRTAEKLVDYAVTLASRPSVS